VRKLATCVFASLLLGIPAVAAAQQTATYTYDALGRVVTAQHTGANNTTMSVNYDNADNRTSLSVTGSSAFRRVMVLPLAGFVVIPLP
jgi:YD repeat-containing protein